MSTKRPVECRVNPKSHNEKERNTEKHANTNQFAGVNLALSQRMSGPMLATAINTVLRKFRLCDSNFRARAHFRNKSDVQLQSQLRMHAR